MLLFIDTTKFINNLLFVYDPIVFFVDNGIYSFYANNY
jgi:hypothetical protein